MTKNQKTSLLMPHEVALAQTDSFIEKEDYEPTRP